MTPTLPAFGAVAASLSLAALVGVAAGRWWARREFAQHLKYTAAPETDLARVERELAHLAAEAATFPRRLQAAYDAGLSGRQQATDAATGDPWPLSRLPGGEWVEIPPQQGQKLWGDP